MANQQENQPNLEELVIDLAYLRDEARALQTVIKDIPVNDQPPGQLSIIQIFFLLDRIQDQVISVLKAIQAEQWEDLSSFKPYQQFEQGMLSKNEEGASESEEGIHDVLADLISNRKLLVNQLQSITIAQLQHNVAIEGGENKSMAALLRELVIFERKKLKEVADRVLVYSQEQFHQRELKQQGKSFDNND